MSNAPKGRTVPTVFESQIKFEWFRKFTIRERIAILLGSNLVVMVSTAVQHNPGKFQPFVMGKVTKELGADEHMRQLSEQMLEARKPKYEIVKESKP